MTTTNNERIPASAYRAAASPRALGRKSTAPKMPAMCEEAVQVAVMQHLAHRGVPGLVAFHPANGGHRHKGTAARLQAQGVVPGIPDVIAIHAGQVFALELKADSGRVSDAQNDMHARLRLAGAHVAVAYGLDAALAQIEAWGLFRARKSS
jgi:hypothetical protein